MVMMMMMMMFPCVLVVGKRLSERIRVQIKLRQTECIKGQENMSGRVRDNNFQCVKNRVNQRNHAPSFE
jgi:hypothetical protein